ncbi:MAG: Alpha-keto acid-binding periplasmic protein TakP [Alphaproteobacteria bacterium MarineAlpha9_Bin4]|nr:MAG: Alpha-keto acid-binding periplasmic protein TakP [Alphaproteobacteria bacterium MarineAlpha9_Bin4]
MFRLLKLFIVLLSILLISCSEREGSSSKSDQSEQRIKKIKWKMASTFPGSLTQLGTAGIRFQNQISKVSGKNIQIKFFEPGALVPALEVFDAVSSGSVDAGWSTPGYWAGKVPALPLFAAVPFGPSAQEYMAWIYYGGGQELFEEIYAEHNIKGIFCGVIPPEASGWFRKEINTVEDMKGMKMRFFGLGAKVMEKIGVSTQLIAGGDIFPALELGTIDATEFSMPAVDLDLGFYQVAKHYYFPGWHQQSTLQELMINMDKWNSLSETQKVQIETTCGDNMRNGIAEGEAIQVDALNTLKEKGVKIHRWNDEILNALEEAWIEVVNEESKNDADFKRSWESLSSFRKEIEVWKSLGYLDN